MVGGFFFLLHPIALMAWLILSQVLWQELMALSLLPLWGCVGWPQQMTNFLGVNYNLFVINPGTDSMTTTQTVTQSRLNPLDRGKPLVQQVASNCCPQAGLRGCAGGYMLPYQPAYPTCGPVSITYWSPIPELLTCFSYLHHEASSIPSPISTPPTSHFLPYLSPRV